MSVRNHHSTLRNISDERRPRCRFLTSANMKIYCSPFDLPKLAQVTHVILFTIHRKIDRLRSTEPSEHYEHTKKGTWPTYFI